MSEIAWFSYSLALLIESGQSWVQSIHHLIPTLPKRLQRDMKVLIHDIYSGRDRRKSIENFLKRKMHKDLKRLIQILVHSMDKGTSIAEPLKTLSKDLYFEQENELERRKNLLGTKMLFPLFLFIFPAVMLVVLSPLIFSILRGGFF